MPVYSGTIIGVFNKSYPIIIPDSEYPSYPIYIPSSLFIEASDYKKK